MGCLCFQGVAWSPCSVDQEAVDYISQAPLHDGFLLGSANGSHSQSTGGREERLGCFPLYPSQLAVMLTGCVLPAEGHSCQAAPLLQLPVRQ